MKNLKAFFELLTQFPEEEWDFVKKQIETLQVQKGQVLQQVGSSADKIYFVSQGLLKTFFLEADGKEATKGFIWKNRVAASYVSIITRQPANLGILALEPSELKVLPAKLLSQLFSRHSSWQEIGRKIAESLLVEREKREHQMLVMNATERYEAFLNHFNEIVDRIPLYEIASYLGITPVALSQIRSQNRKNNHPSLVGFQATTSTPFEK